MCDPVTALTVVSTAVGVAGSFMQAQAASAQASYEAQVAMANAEREQEQARESAEIGEATERDVRLAGNTAVARTRSALAANNMDTSFGSPLDTIITTSMEVERDAHRARRNTSAEFRDAIVRKYNFLNDASAARARGRNARTAGFVAGIGTALSGASSAVGARQRHLARIA